ncbi:transcriptional regulator swi6, partial [Rhizoclosmatium hyalinum]
ATDDGGNQVPAKKQRTDDSEDEVFAAPSKPLLFVRPDATRADKSKAFLLSLFISSTPQTTTATKKSWPDYLSLATPLDVKGNTAVHWAASLGHTDTLQEILAFAATHKDNPLTSVNYAQETALMRALHLPNNHIRKSFPLILSLLPSKDLLHLKDAHNQTLFHHAVASVIASSISIEACVYYLSCIKDVFGLLHPAQEGTSSSSASTTSSSSSLKLESSSVSFLNEKDWNGDTALSLARRCIPGAGPIADLLISMGASDIPDPVSFE